MSTSTRYRPIYLVLTLIGVGVIFFLSYFVIEQATEADEPCNSNPEIICAKEYSDIVSQARAKNDSDVCNKVKAYIKNVRVGIAGERKEKIPKKQARKSCVSAVKQSNQKKEGFFTQSVPNDWSTYRNEKYKFSFRYPSNWQYHEGERGRDQHLICLYPGSYGGGCPGLVTINKNTDLESWHRKIKRPYEEANIQRSQVSIDGASGILIQEVDSQNVASGEILLEAEGFFYNITFFPEYESELKKLMSSFQFEN